MTAPKIKVTDFVKASRTYVEKSVAKANRNKNAYLSPSEQKKLPKDLRDNLKNSQKGSKAASVRAKAFATAFTSYVALSAKKADKNKDGVLSAADAARLPKDLRDNFKNYVAATKQVWSDGGASKVKDKTSPTRIAEHLAAYGTSPVTYAEAFAKGVKAVLEDRDYGPGNVLREVGDLSEAQVKKELEKAFKSMTLMPVGETSESGFDPQDTWIFELDADVGSDHGFWVGVDRQSGEAQVTSFN